jgi:alpha-tubulin suppressor-like RCC1 family protein
MKRLAVLRWSLAVTLMLGFVPSPKASAATDIQQIAVGVDHNLILKSDGTVWGWGDNLAGELGNGSNYSSYSQVQAQGLSDIAAISAGYLYSLALKKDGTVWSWGEQDFNSKRPEPSIPQTVPMPLTDSSDPSGVVTHAKAISAGTIAFLVLKDDGSVWSWGSNASGQSGSGKTSSDAPVTIGLRVKDDTDPSGYLTNVKAISAGNGHCLALKQDGTVWVWGDGRFGQLGIPKYATGNWELDSAVKIEGLEHVVSVYAGHATSAAILEDGSLWTWGNASNQAFGEDSINDHPVKVNVPNKVIQVSLGEEQHYALDQNGVLWTWGKSADPNWIYQIMGTIDNPLRLSSPINVSEVSSTSHTIVRTTNGELLAWGMNIKGELGDGTTAKKFSPVRVTNENPKLSDISDTYWAAPSIRGLAEAQIVSGYVDGTFKPGNAVSRAEFVRMIAEMLILPLPWSGGIDDIVQNWAQGYIERAIKAGIVSGYIDNNNSHILFHPDQKITRAEMISIIVKAYHLKTDTNAAISFQDVPTNHWAYTAIQAAVINNVAHGFQDGRFQPNGFATRAEAASMLYAMKQRSPMKQIP